MSEEQLIILVKDRPILYDRKHSEYRQIEVKEKIWKEIAVELKISEIKCRTKWKALRDQFLREVKRKNYNAGDDTEIRWKHFSSLKFLLETSYPRKSFAFNNSDVGQFIKNEYFTPSLVTIKKPSKVSIKKEPQSLPQVPENVDLPFSMNMKGDQVEEENIKKEEPLSIQNPASTKIETTIIKKKRKVLKKEHPSELKRSIIQVQTTTLVPENSVVTFPSAKQNTNVKTLLEPQSPMTTPPLATHQLKTEAEDCDDGMDMFFQSVKRTIRSTNFSPMEKLDLQMSILQVLREKIFLKNGTTN
ncbi:hypothetical protein ACFFRR_001049 [Megaselia abdita]